jgi:hypothetical protein
MLSISAGCDPAIVEKASQARNYPDADSPATFVARADSGRGPRDAISFFRLYGAPGFPSFIPAR